MGLEQALASQVPPSWAADRTVRLGRGTSPPARVSGAVASLVAF